MLMIKLKYQYKVLYLVCALTIPLNENPKEHYSKRTNLKSEINLSKGSFNGLCYSGYRDNENPDNNVNPTLEEIKQDIELIKLLTSSIRTYGVTSSLGKIPEICQQAGIDCYPGAWISKLKCENETQVSKLISIAKQGLSNVKGLNVGCEVLLRNDISVQQLIGYINEVKNVSNLPVSTSEIWGTWLKYPELANVVDVIYVHIYPFWDGISIDNAATYLLEKYNLVKAAYPDKKIVIGETGWPSSGNQRGQAVPSETNQKKYISDFLNIASQNNIEYFIFETFDEKWKSETNGNIGQHWGIFNSNGSIKPQLADLIPPSAVEGIDRKLRIITQKNIGLPFYVYKDGCDTINGFYASGWMGELSSILLNDSIYKNPEKILDQSYSTLPHSGNSCIRISYSPSFNQWGGIYWQFPVNNWGSYPGYTLNSEGPVYLSFWAKGLYGGEKAEFITGGINKDSLQYKDSYPAQTTDIVSLTMDWQQYYFTLTKLDLSNIIGGFCWVTNYDENPDGCTIFLDDIVFSKLLITSAINIQDDKEVDFSLYQNYPNPFKYSTLISFSIKRNALVSIKIYDILGREVATIVNESLSPGFYTRTWIPDRINANFFLCSMRVGIKEKTIPVIRMQ
jgi:exo-beta-1,3-glucanase (GH17 family)